jgi:hypothetical protein
MRLIARDSDMRPGASTRSHSGYDNKQKLGGGLSRGIIRRRPVRHLLAGPVGKTVLRPPADPATERGSTVRQNMSRASVGLGGQRVYGLEIGGESRGRAGGDGQSNFREISDDNFRTVHGWGSVL